MIKLYNFGARSLCAAVCGVTALHLTLNSPCSILDLQKVHARVIKTDLYPYGFLGDRLVSAYANCGLSIDASRLFDEIPRKDLVSWNSLISAFSRNRNYGESLNIFRWMISANLKPNFVTVVSVASAYGNINALDEGMRLHGYVEKAGFLSFAEVVNSLITMHGKCGLIDLAHKLFEVVTTKNTVSWNSIITIHSQTGSVEGVFVLFNSMRRAEIKPDRATVVSVLQGCANLAAVRKGIVIHGYIVSNGFSMDTPVKTALITFYAKSGNLNSSCEIFGEMNDPDNIAWTAMVGAYAVHGQGRAAIEVFEDMIIKGEIPDHVTFTHVLNACSHSGLVIEGEKYFKAMAENYKIQVSVDHYSCMVDLLGRFGLLEEARQLIESMTVQPNSAVWGALLGACRVHRNIKLGKEAADRLYELNPSDPRNYIILSNIYSREGLWEESSKVRALMKERGLGRTPGCSFIEYGGKVLKFVVDDRSHPESQEMYDKLAELTRKMSESGYVPETEFVLHDVADNLKVEMISTHSEKLAIAFGLLNIGAGMPIMIIKNLRICGDCHNAAKFISAIENRVLIIRDSKRFHHFREGTCSCGDYW
ncbi:pentatricopeptide repeat-containing protein At5g40410, mitochondrial [Aristolochia californica]|uniref:pentatricopeptide repeat-containing protein At5g40410, mitochondrial n=1 Tax=Aristolochia californica TaxID=171875 RepID=UPI0035E0A94A